MGWPATKPRDTDHALREWPPDTAPPAPRFFVGGAPEQVTRILRASISTSVTQGPPRAGGRGSGVTGPAAPPWTRPASGPSAEPRADAIGPQFPCLCRLASGPKRAPAARRLYPELTGRRGTISTEQQWQKYRPGCGDASAMAAATSSAPPAPCAAPAAGRLLLPRRPTRSRTLTHGTHSVGRSETRGSTTNTAHSSSGPETVAPEGQTRCRCFLC